MSRDRDCAVGSLRTSAPYVLADRLAWRVMDYAGPRAVTVDPQGRVWVEPPTEAAECDVVGVYQRDVGALTLTRMIREDLLWTRERLGTMPKRRMAQRKGGA